jgi:protease I
MRAVIVSGRGVQDAELVYPYYRLKEAGYEVDLATRGKQPFQGIQGVKFDPNTDVSELSRNHHYRMLVIPGGVKAMEHMRLDDELVRYVSDFHADGGLVASICSGAQMLISAGLVKGRKIAAYPAMRVDVENAGGEYIDAPAVADDRIITAPHYRNLGDWMSMALQVTYYPAWMKLCEGT